MQLTLEYVHPPEVDRDAADGKDETGTESFAAHEAFKPGICAGHDVVDRECRQRREENSEGSEKEGQLCNRHSSQLSRVPKIRCFRFASFIVLQKRLFRPLDTIIAGRGIRAQLQRNMPNASFQGLQARRRVDIGENAANAGRLRQRRHAKDTSGVGVDAQLIEVR